jgi:8-oxo-dGTP pyrophosphatase MutT (NUDIX family)
MPIPPHIADLRALVGHRLLWVATARAVAVDSHGLVVLGRYRGSAAWAIPGGVVDPGEQPADAAIRECFEETGIIAVPEALTSVTVSELVTHTSGDLTQHLELTFRCRATGGAARPGDGEFEDVRWHRVNALPELSAYERAVLAQAVTDGGQAAFSFSGLTRVLGLPEADVARRPADA